MFFRKQHLNTNDDFGYFFAKKNDLYFKTFKEKDLSDFVIIQNVPVNTDLINKNIRKFLHDNMNLINCENSRCICKLKEFVMKQFNGLISNKMITYIVRNMKLQMLKNDGVYNESLINDVLNNNIKNINIDNYDFVYNENGKLIFNLNETNYDIDNITKDNEVVDYYKVYFYRGMKQIYDTFFDKNNTLEDNIVSLKFGDYVYNKQKKTLKKSGRLLGNFIYIEQKRVLYMNNVAVSPILIFFSKQCNFV